MRGVGVLQGRLLEKAFVHKSVYGSCAPPPLGGVPLWYNFQESQMKKRQLLTAVRKSILAIFIISMFALEIPNAVALERVTIIGKNRQFTEEDQQRLMDAIDMFTSARLAGDMLLMNQAAADIIEIVGIDPTSDIRCFSSGQSTTSRAEGEVRHGLAIQMYRVRVGANRAQRVGTRFSVTWADGGSTSYIVTANGPGALLGWGTEIETPGDGVAKDGPICSNNG